MLTKYYTGPQALAKGRINSRCILLFSSEYFIWASFCTLLNPKKLKIQCMKYNVFPFFYINVNLVSHTNGRTEIEGSV